MKQQRVVFLLACVGILCAAIASAPAAIGHAKAPVTVAQAAVPVPPALEPGSSPDQPDACPPLPPSTDEQFTPAACRLRPECSTDDDCAALCQNGGRCVHSKCPILICKCN